MSKQPLPLNFEDLSNHPINDNLGPEVEIRGFLYETPAGEMILAANPHLKSCCVGSPGKISQQIFLRGKWESVPLKRAVTVKGQLIADPKYNEGRELVQLYVMEHPVIMQSSSFPVWSFVSIAAFLVLVVLFKQLRRREQKK
jgi:hypothetical protein